MKDTSIWTWVVTEIQFCLVRKFTKKNLEECVFIMSDQKKDVETRQKRDLETISEEEDHIHDDRVTKKPVPIICVWPTMKIPPHAADMYKAFTKTDVTSTMTRVCDGCNEPIAPDSKDTEHRCETANCNMGSYDLCLECTGKGLSIKECPKGYGCNK